MFTYHVKEVYKSFSLRRGEDMSVFNSHVTYAMYGAFILSVSPSSRGILNKREDLFYPARAMGQNPEASLSFCPGKRETTYKNNKERF